MKHNNKLFMLTMDSNHGNSHVGGIQKRFWAKDYKIAIEHFEKKGFENVRFERVKNVQHDYREVPIEKNEEICDNCGSDLNANNHVRGLNDNQCDKCVRNI